MKRIIILLTLSLSVLPASAAMHTVSSDGLADFTDVQPAINLASPGDTILVYPGGTYGGFIVDKQLIIMGGGIEPSINKNTRIAGIVELTSAADGTELRSLWITSNPGVGGSPNQPAAAVVRIHGDCYNVFMWRVLIENNQPSGGYVISALWVGDTASVRLHECALWASQVASSNSFSIIADSLSAITLESCVVSRWAWAVYSLYATAASPLNLRHCLIESFGYYGIYGSFSGSVENTAFISATPSNGTPNMTFAYNALGVDGGTEFTSYVTYSPQTSDYHLVGGSALINAGNPSSPFDLDGSQADIGVYGGQHPYVKNGAPDFPFVVELEVPISAPADGTIPIFTRGRIGPGN